MQRQLKTASATIEKAAGNAGTFVLSSTALDRDFDNITLDALKNAASKTSKLLCLWQHDRQQPIGAWEKLRLEGQKLLGDLRLASTNLGQMVKTLLDEDVPLSSSIGFMGAGRLNDSGGITYYDIELLECSVVSVPANPQAQRIAKDFGYDIRSLTVDPAMAASGLTASSDAILKAKRAIMRVNLMRKMK